MPEMGREQPTLSRRKGVRRPPDALRITVALLFYVCLGGSAFGDSVTARSASFTLDTVDADVGPPALDASVTARSGSFTVDTRLGVPGYGRSALFTVDTRDAFGVREVTSPYSSKDRPAVFVDGVSLDVPFTAVVGWNGRTPGKVRFITPRGTHTQAAANLTRTFDVGSDFGPKGRLKVVAIDAQGHETAPFDANIAVAPLPPALSAGLLQLKEGRQWANGRRSFSYRLLNLGSFGMYKEDDLAPTVPDRIPLFGGHGYGFRKLIDIKLAVEIADGRARYAGTKGGEDQGRFGEYAILYADPSSNEALSIGGVKLGTELGCGVAWQYDASQAAWALDSGFLTAGIGAEVELGPYYLPVPSPVPVYFLAEIGAELDAELGIEGFSAAAWDLYGTLEPVLRGRGYAGAGIAHALALEVYLGIEGGLELAWPTPPALRDAYVTLTGGLRVVCLFREWEADLLEWTWSMAEGRWIGPEQWLPDWRTSPGTLLPRTYLGMREARGEGAGGRVPSCREAAPGGTETVLATNVFPYAQPALALRDPDGPVMLLWAADDGTRSDANRTLVMARSLVDGTWGTDNVVDADDTADFAPAVAPMETGFVAAWEDFGAVLADDAPLEDMLAAEEISVATYDAANGEWSSPVRLTDNGVVDHGPCVASAADGSALVVWIRNEWNDVLGSADRPNSLVYSHSDGTRGWSGPEEFAVGVGAVVKTALSFDGQAATYVVSIDADADLSTDTDQELYRTDFTVAGGWSGLVRLTTDGVADTNPQLLPDGNGGVLLFWYRDGDVMQAEAADVADMAPVVQTVGDSGCSDFRVCRSPFGQIAIVYGAASPEGQDLYASIYDTQAETWGAPVQLTADPDMERSPAAAYQADGTLVTVYNKVPMPTIQRTVQVGGEDVVVAVPTPDYDNVSLCTLSRVIAGDLEVADVRVEPGNPEPGATAQISVTVRNAGDLAAVGVVVALYDGDPGAGGTPIGERLTIPGMLAAGAVAEVTADWAVPADADSGRSVFAVVDPDGMLNDRDRANNAGSVTVLLPDLIVEELLVETLGAGSWLVTAALANRGVTPAAGVTVVARDTSAEAAVVAQTTVDLPANGDVEWSFVLTEADDRGSGAGVLVLIDPDNTVVETCETNNTRGTTGDLPAAPAPVITPPAGLYAGSQTVTIACPLAGATIRYTTDGSAPGEMSPVYEAPFAVSTPAAVKARAYAVGYEPSPTAGVAYAFEGANRPPVVAGVLKEAVAGETRQFALLAEGEDPDAGPQALAYTWRVISAPAAVSFGAENGTEDGTAVNAAFSAPGTYELGLSVSDGEAAAAGGLRIDLVNAVPVIEQGESVSVTCDEDNAPLTFALTLRAGEADGDALTWDIRTPDSESGPHHGTAEVVAVREATEEAVTLTYTPAPDWHGEDRFTVDVTDPFGGTDSVAVTVTVRPVNDAPSVDLNGVGEGTDFAAAFTEDLGAKAVVDVAALAVADVDSDMLTSATVRIATVLDGAAESLSVQTAGRAVTAEYDPETGVLSLTGKALVAEYQTVLRTVTYDNTSQDPDPTPRVITFVANDGEAESATATCTVAVHEVNDPPLAGNDTLASVLEDSGPRLIGFGDLTQDDSPGVADEAGQDLTVVSVGNATGGTAAVVGQSVEFALAQDFSGEASFEYTVQDNGTSRGAPDPKSDVGVASFAVVRGAGMRLWAEDADGPVELGFGEAETATEDLDGWDSVGEGALIAWLFNQRVSDPANQLLSRDFRPCADTTRWRLVLPEESWRDAVTLSWDVAAADGHRAVYLQRMRGEQTVGFPVDMRTTAWIEATPDSQYEIAYAETDDVSCPLSAGWSLVGNPIMTELSIGEVLSDGGRGSLHIGPVWTFEDGAYRRCADAEPFSPERGHWVYSLTGQDSRAATGIRADGLVALQPGWNLVSPVSDCDVPGHRRIRGPVLSWHAPSGEYRKVAREEGLQGGVGYWICIDGTDPCVIRLGE